MSLESGVGAARGNGVGVLSTKTSSQIWMISSRERLGRNKRSKPSVGVCTLVIPVLWRYKETTRAIFGYILS